MARVPKITRTITVTKAKVLCMDVSTASPVEKEVVVPRTYKNENDLLKAVKAIAETDTLKPVHILSSVTEQTLYGMNEAKFIANAEILPPRVVEATDSVSPTD